MRTTKLRRHMVPMLMLTASGCGVSDGSEITWPVGEAADVAEATEDERSNVLRATLDTPLGKRTVTYKMVDGKRVVEGDIVLPDAADLGDGVIGAAPSTLPKWTGNVIPYVFDGLLPTQTQQVEDAISEYQRRTAIRFVPRGTQSNYIRFVDGTGCSAQVGMGSNRTVTLGSGCSLGNTRHELAHVAGLWHEHTRPDRDTYVTVHWGNIEAGEEDNFDIQSIDSNAGAGPYDFGSIMHYPSTAFGVGGTWTLTTKSGGQIFAQRDALSAGDLHSVNTIYPPPLTASPAQCRTAPPRGTVRRADVAEAWEDRGSFLTLAVHASQGTSFAAPSDWNETTDNFAARLRYAAGDFDGDGDQDLAEIFNNGGYNAVWIRKSSGSAFTAQSWLSQSGFWAASTQWLPGDFNGDGKTDLASAWNDGGWSSVAVWLSTGTGFSNPTQWAYRDGGWGDTVKWNVGDFDADGKDDILAVWNSSGYNTLTVRKSTGSAFTVQHWAVNQGGWDNNTHWVVGDFDGNGSSDVTSVWNSGGFASFAVYKSTGTAFMTPQHWLSSNGGFGTDDQRWMAGDVDADGRADIISAWKDDSMTTLSVRRSTGTAFQSASAYGTRVAGWQYSASFCAGSFNLN